MGRRTAGVSRWAREGQLARTEREDVYKLNPPTPGTAIGGYREVWAVGYAAILWPAVAMISPADRNSRRSEGGVNKGQGRGCELSGLRLPGGTAVAFTVLSAWVAQVGY